VAVGLTGHLPDMGEIAELAEANFPKTGRPATYKKTAAEISN
jgi:hypothetical protein